MVKSDSSDGHKTSLNFSPGLSPIVLIFTFFFNALIKSKIRIDGIFGTKISPPNEFFIVHNLCLYFIIDCLGIFFAS